MNTTVAVKEAPSILQDMAARYGMDKRAFEATLKATVIPANVSNEQLAAFLLVAKEYKLNPLTKEIYAFPAKSGGIQPIVGIDGWCNIINSHPQLNGKVFKDIMDDKGNLIAITCKIYRKDQEHPTECTEYLNECKRPTEPWKQWPARMLRHKALIQCARYAFGFSGIVDQDEAERMVDVTPHDVRPAELDKTKPASPFKTATLRNQFHKNVKESLENAKNGEEAIQIMSLNKAKFIEMEASGDERDQMSVDDLKQYFAIVLSRFTEVMDTTPAEDAGTFEDEEVPAFIKQQMQEENERLAAKGF